MRPLLLALALTACAHPSGCAGPPDSALTPCAAELGEALTSRELHVGNGVLDYAADDADMTDAEGFLHVLASQAEYEAFWAANAEVLGVDAPAVDFAVEQVVAANGVGIGCKTNVRLRGFFRAADGAGLVAWVYTDVACGGSCDTAGPPRVELWAVEHGAIAVCGEEEVCPDSG